MSTRPEGFWTWIKSCYRAVLGRQETGMSDGRGDVEQVNTYHFTTVGECKEFKQQKEHSFCLN